MHWRKLNYISDLDLFFKIIKSIKIGVTGTIVKAHWLITLIKL